MSLPNAVPQHEKLKSTLLKTISSIQEQPDRGKVVFTADTEISENVRVKAKTRTFEFTFDEPNNLGGDNLSYDRLRIQSNTCLHHLVRAKKFYTVHTRRCWISRLML